jgi:hypothetical protein
MEESSRVAAGRERAAQAKRTIAVAAIGGLLAALLLARATHPGAAARRSSLVPPTSLVAQAQVGSALAAGSIGPSSSGASAATSVS